MNDSIEHALPPEDLLPETLTLSEPHRRLYEESVVRMAYLLGMPSELVDSGEVEGAGQAIRNRGASMARELARRACGMGLEFRIWALRNDPICLHWLLAAALQHTLWALGWIGGRPFAFPERPVEWYGDLGASDEESELLQAVASATGPFDRAQAVNEFVLAVSYRLLDVPDPDSRPAELDALRRLHQDPIMIRPEPYRAVPVRRNWERVARGLAQTYSQIPSIDAMAVVGSVASGHADTWSDLNLAAVAEEIPSMAQRFMMLSGAADPRTDIVQTRGEDRIIINGVLTRIRMMKRREQEEWIEGPASTSPSPNGAMGLEELINGLPVFDRRGVLRRWREKASATFEDHRQLWIQAEAAKFKEYLTGLQLAAGARDGAGTFINEALAVTAMARAAMLRRGLPTHAVGPLWARMVLDKPHGRSRRKRGSEFSALLLNPGRDFNIRRQQLLNAMADLL